MNSKNFRFIVLLMLIAFTCISIGGCGGSSSSGGGGSSSKPSTTLDSKSLDSDGSGTPDIVEFDDDVKQETISTGGAIQNYKISSIPARLSFKRNLASVESAENFETAADSVVSGEVTDSFKANLTKGTEYTVEVSRGDAYNYPIGNRLTNLEILNPSGTALNFFDTESGSSIKEDEIELSVYPVDEPYMICLTFTPSVTGDYTLNLTHVISEDDDMTIFVYEECRNETDNSAGYHTRYKLTDDNGNESATINMNDIMALRKAWNETESVYTSIVRSDDASIEEAPTEEIISKAAAYLDVLRDIKQQYGIFDDYIEDPEYTNGRNSYASAVSDSDSDFSTAETVISGDANGTVVPAEIYGINYDDKYSLGMGFFGITGTQAQNRAVLKRVITEGIAPSKKKKPVKSLYKAAFVSSQEDSERLTSTTVDAGIQLGGFGFNAGHSSSNSFKYGLTSTTFVIHYEETENQYRMLDDDEEYQLNSKGKRMLKEGAKAFRAEFGDYFVGGYQYGGTYDVFITVTTKTTEQLEKVKTNLSASFKTEDLALSSDVANKSKNFLKTNDADITIEVRTAGISDDGGETKTLTDLAQIADSLLNFKQQLKKTTPDEFLPVYVMLKRFRLLPDVFDKMLADKDNGLIPIPASHSTKVMNFRKDMGTMHAYYNIIRDTDNTTMDQGVKEAYRQRYDNINNTVAAEGPTTLYEVSNAAKLEQLHKDMLQLNSELKAVGDRFVFYKLLMVEQTKEASLNSGNGTENVTSKPYGAGGGTIGYRSFQSSKVVQSDIAAGTEQKDEINQFSGSEWTPSFYAGKDRIFNHIEVIANNINDYRRKANPPCIGSENASFYFRCGGSRWLEWTVKVHSMRFTQALYPFSGLK